MNEIRTLLRNRILDGVYFNSVEGVAGTSWPIGTPEIPVNNLPDLRIILTARNLKTIMVLGNMTLDADMPYTFIGQNPVSIGTAAIDINGQDISDATFIKLYVTGTQAALGGGMPIFFGCTFESIVDFQGYAIECIFWELSQGGNDNYYLDCYFGGSLDANGYWAQIHGGVGALEIMNVTAGEIMFRGFRGSLVIDASCIGGNIQLHGDMRVENNGASTIWDFRTSGFIDTRFYQETAPATNVDGTTWKDLLDMGLLAVLRPMKICGFTVTVAGGWAGNAKIRIVDGAGTKIFPFQDEYVQGVDFTSGTQKVFDFPCDVSPAKGYKFQFRSSNAGDGAGKTLQLNNLDMIELS